MSDIRPPKSHELNKMSEIRSPEVGKSKRDLKALEVIDLKLTLQIERIK